MADTIRMESDPEIQEHLKTLQERIDRSPASEGLILSSYDMRYVLEGLQLLETQEQAKAKEAAKQDDEEAASDAAGDYRRHAHYAHTLWYKISDYQEKTMLLFPLKEENR